MMEATAKAMPTQIPTRPPTLTPTHTPAPTKVPINPVSIIEQALSNLTAVGSYQLEADQETRLKAEGVDITVLTKLRGDVANNQDFTGVQTVRLLGETVRADLVILDGTHYLKEHGSP